MTRRQFVRYLGLALILGGFQTRLPFGRFVDEVSGAALETRFSGRSLFEIARQKLHHGEGVFINPFNPRHERSLWRVLQWKLFSSNKEKQRYSQEQVVPICFDWKQVRSHDGLAITYLPHAGMMIKDAGSYIIIDPILFGLSSLIKNFTPIAGGLENMPEPDLVLLTHGHYDHMDVDTLARLDARTHVISPLGYDKLLREIGFQHRTQMDWYDAVDLGRRCIHFLPCNHWTMRNPLKGKNRSLWGSFLLETASGPTIFIGGDTAYFDGFQEIGRQFKIDLAVFNVGAYEPRWFMRHSHMDPAETVSAFKVLKARNMMILHWGTFRLGNEPVYDPPRKIQDELRNAGLVDRWLQVKHGQTLFIS